MKPHIALITCSFGFRAAPFDNSRERFPDCVRHQMPNVELFERIRVGVFDDDFFAFQIFISPEILFFMKDVFHALRKKLF